MLVFIKSEIRILKSQIETLITIQMYSAVVCLCVEHLLYKKDRAQRFHTSTFDIRYSIFCGSLFHGSAVRFSMVLRFAFPWFCSSLFPASAVGCSPSPFAVSPMPCAFYLQPFTFDLFPFTFDLSPFSFDLLVSHPR